MSPQWDNLTIDVVKIVLDKVLLGGMIAIATYWLQKRLEVFRRNQALTSEVAKARLTAYHRVFKCVAGANFAAKSAWGLIDLARRESDKDRIPLHWKAAEAQVARLRECIEKLQIGVSEDVLLLNDSFSAAAWKCGDALCASLMDATDAVISRSTNNANDRKRHSDLLDQRHAALLTCLPPFVRTPEEDIHFKEPLTTGLPLPTKHDQDSDKLR